MVMDSLTRQLHSLPSELIHHIRSFLPPLPPRPKYRDNGLDKQLEAIQRSPKLTAMALYESETGPKVKNRKGKRDT